MALTRHIIGSEVYNEVKTSCLLKLNNLHFMRFEINCLVTCLLSPILKDYSFKKRACPRSFNEGGNSSIGRVAAFQAVGCGFESRFPLQILLNKHQFVKVNNRVLRFLVENTRFSG